MLNKKYALNSECTLNRKGVGIKAGLSTACKRGVILNCLDRDGRVCYGECRLRTPCLQECLASSTGRAAHS